MRSGWANATLLLSIMCAAPAARAAKDVPFGVDLEGHPVSTLVASGTRAVVLLFTATDCPISKRYLPDWERLTELLQGQRVKFYMIYPNPGETATGVRAQQTAFGSHTPALLDTTQSLAHLAGVHVTPEAAVFVPVKGGLREVYHGRIDDRYMDLGHQRPQATRRELERAVKAVLAGAPVEPPRGQAVGCSIIPIAAAAHMPIAASRP